MLICDLDGGRLAKVDARARIHDGCGREDIMDCDGVGYGVEGGDDAAEGFEWRE